MSDTLTNLNGWYWVEWRGTLEPELFRDGRIYDHDGDWIIPAPTRKIGPRIPEPEELKATELELAKLRNRVDDLDKTLAETQDERDRLRTAIRETDHEICQTIGRALGYPWFGDDPANFPGATDTDGVCVGDHVAESIAKEAANEVVRLREERDRLRAEVERLRLKEDGGWRFFLGGHGFRAVRHDKPGWYFDTDKKCAHEINAKTSDCLINNQRELTAAEAYARLADWPEWQAKFRELTGYEPPTCKESLPVQPEERVRCYRSKSGGVWVYGVQHDTYFSSYGGWDPAQSESITREYDIPCTIAQARALLADRPNSLAEFDRIVGWDEDRERLARLMAIPCKEMRV